VGKAKNAIGTGVPRLITFKATSLPHLEIVTKLINIALYGSRCHLGPGQFCEAVKL